MSDAIWNRDVPSAISEYPAEGLTVTVDAEGPDKDAPRVDPKTGALEIPTSDGGVVVDFNARPDDDTDEDFDSNLAEKLDAGKLSSLAETLLEAISADDQSRTDWLEQRAKGLDLLGLKIEPPRGSAPSSSAPLDGMATVRNPLLLEAVLRFQANARGELLPSSGPVKVRDDGGDDEEASELAEALEKDLNHYLTVDAPEYYPDTDRMFFWVGFGGSGFKKVYSCPIRQRPVSESVDAQDLIVSDAITDLRNAGRITQCIVMRPSVMKRMQILGAYRDITLTQPTQKPTPVDEKEAQIQGIATWTTRPEDQPYSLYECYCEINIPGFEDKDAGGEETGLPLPYRVTIERDSRAILAIHRDWDEEDDSHKQKRTFVEFPYIKGLGFYGIGLLHILGNATMALTAAWREALDAGMFANFPGFLIAKIATRQNTSEMRVAPGTGYPIDTGNIDIGKAVMPLPYKDITPGLMQLIDKIQSAAQRIGSTAELSVGEGNQDAPVGTTLALIEQATKIESAVHKRLHASQSEEFQLLRDLIAKDPSVLWRKNRKSAVAVAMGIKFDAKNPDQDDDPAYQQQIATFTTALNDANLIPVADPNTPSHVHRLLKAVALKQLQAASPGLYNGKEVDTRILHMIGWSDAESLFAPPQPPQAPPVDPVQQQMLQLKSRELDIKQQQIAMDAQQSDKESAAKQNVATIDLAREIAIHGTNADLAQASLQTNGAATGSGSNPGATGAPQASASAGGRIGGSELGDEPRRAPDGHWYIPDPVRSGMYLKLIHSFKAAEDDPFHPPPEKKPAPKKPPKI